MDDMPPDVVHTRTRKTFQPILISLMFIATECRDTQAIY